MIEAFKANASDKIVLKNLQTPKLTYDETTKYKI